MSIGGRPLADQKTGEPLCCEKTPLLHTLRDQEPNLPKQSPVYHGAVDYIKAIAIVCVVITHSGLRGSDPDLSALERIIRQSWVGFQVPAFFLVAGFLYHKREQISLPEMLRRLSRILVPYLIASVIALMLGFGRPLTFDRVLFNLATGNVIGIYYFVFALCLCIPFIWLYSRIPVPLIWLLLALLLGYSALFGFGYLTPVTQGFFWRARDLLVTFFLGYFTIGWLVAEYFDGLKAALLPRRHLLLAPLAAGVVLYASLKARAFWLEVNPTRPFSFYKIGYSLGVTSLIILTTYRLGVPRFVRFLSEASLTIYLYHRIIQLELLPMSREWDILPRFVFLLLAGLLGSSLIAGLGRTIAAKRSRLLLGY